MAKNEPNKPDDVKTEPKNEAQTEDKAAPVNEQTELGGEAPLFDLTDEEAAILAQEGEAALRDIGEEQLEPPAPFDIGGEHIPDPADNIVSFDKAKSDKQAAQEAPEDKDPEPEKKARQTAESG